MAYKVIILYQLYMPSYFLGTFTEYPYSMGHFLTDSLRPLFHLTGTEENYAFVTPEAIYEKKHSGRIVVTDSLLNPIDHPMSPQLLKEVLEYKNRFRKKD